MLNDNELPSRPKVGVGVFIRKDGKILMQKRRGHHAEGTWSLSGGHLEFGESIEACAIREVKEELDIQITNLKIGPFTNDIFEKEGKHYVTFFVVSDYLGGEEKINEPENTSEIGWFEWGDFPSPLFLSVENLYKTGFDPFSV